MPERKVASTGDRTHNHQVMSPTRSPLSHPGGAISEWRLLALYRHKEILVNSSLKVTQKKKKIGWGNLKKSGERSRAILALLLPFPTMFSRGFFLRVHKSQDGVIKS